VWGQRAEMRKVLRAAWGWGIGHIGNFQFCPSQLGHFFYLCAVMLAGALAFAEGGPGSDVLLRRRPSMKSSRSPIA
jgi:hypothetical protein